MRVSVTHTDLDQAFSKIWLEHKNSVRRYCLRCLSDNPDTVDDVMSITAEKACRFLRSTDTSIQNPLAWLCTMARNVCTDLHRTETREFELVKQVCNSPDTFFFAANNSEPLEQAIEREYELSSLLSAIMKLPQRQQELLSMRVLDGLNYQQMASHTHISTVNLRKIVQLTRQQLRTIRFNQTSHI
ncbi:RNA polymerase sigma factor [Gynuella sunshinyii]|uniref:DNA-directed RNA polymerase specialized sigma subunit, sigma24-like protein n=1 Tax=Gynuella sunshinyii YC6258 TaxID=1445510 RepID=A0A0C5VJ47_9GAMM|nr:sigma-70 family RNA polymerase sigma factor [Gynuella sunshinyii]AJQ94266.1 DNA-directed RNA polymerase specialized sigma subunit, sigma24-like protein [Gynuella sunshinyii YC6258]